ncbi:helix-turn-helix transcriptional regulator [Streptomyces finlayi]|uniref:helix-turn-helix transcriptional regulator n=1 Tax=Streptomyces finlayi TaxID=67296 RepID=UPI00167AF5A6|nr:YafY family protein [Streptomyces finlayi]
MKSSRLLSILLLLQTGGRMTAAQLAAELEVSLRTVYRDVEALVAAGVPLYADAGHGGGYRLLDGYRMRLTGLNSPEAEALFLSGVPGPAAALGLGAELAAARRKLRAALPSELREQADRMSSRFHLDAPGWYAPADEVPYLSQVAEAVWQGRTIEVLYRRWQEPTEVERRLDPYGLVLKAGRWYVVAGAGGKGPRTYRVDQILRLADGGAEFEVPEGFELASYWQQYQADFHARLYQGEAVVRLAPGAGARLTGVAARALETTGVPEPDGWTRAVLPVESLDHAHGAFLALGTDVEVVGPPELRDRLAATVRELALRYGAGSLSGVPYRSRRFREPEAGTLP